MDEFEWKSGKESKIGSSLWAWSDLDLQKTPEDNKNCVAMDGARDNKLAGFDCNMRNDFFCEYS